MNEIGKKVSNARSAKVARTPDFEIGDKRVPAGTRQIVDIPISLLSNHTPVNLTVNVVHGKRPGPAMKSSGWRSSAGF